MKRAIVLAVILGCNGRQDFTDAQLVDLTASLRASGTGSVVEGSATLVVTTEGDDDEVWLETFHAAIDPRHAVIDPMPVDDLVLEVAGVFPLAMDRDTTASAPVRFRGSVDYAPAEGILAWCYDAEEVVVEATYFSSLLESIDGQGTRHLCPFCKVWREGSAQAPPFTISAPITLSPPHTDLTAAWRYTELQHPCSAPLLTASGATVIETCHGARVLNAIEPPGRLAQEKPISGVSGYSHLAAGGATTVLAGRFDDEVDLGEAGLAVARGQQGAFVARLGPALETQWLRALVDPPELACAGGAENDVIRSVGVSRTGIIAVAGKLCGEADLGGGALPAGSEYVLLLGDDGSHLFSRTVAAKIQGVAASEDGGLVMGGSFTGPLDLGAGPEGSAGEHGLWVARLDARGALRWSRRFLQTESLSMQLRLDDVGSVLLIVSRHDGLDFGSGPLPRDAIALAKLTSDGELAWAKHLANSSYYSFDSPASPMGVTADGHIFVALVTDGGSWIADQPLELGSYLGHASFFAELDRDGTVLRRTLYGCGNDGATLSARSDRSEVILSTSVSRQHSMLVFGDESLHATDLQVMSVIASIDR